MITGIDHVAIPTADAERFIRFYRALGLTFDGVEAWRSGAERTFALLLGDQRINVHPETLTVGPGDLRAAEPRPGATDVCLVWGSDIAALLALLAKAGIAVLDGPVARRGGRGPGASVYVRDPDGNLVELITYRP